MSLPESGEGLRRGRLGSGKGGRSCGAGDGVEDWVGNDPGGCQEM